MVPDDDVAWIPGNFCFFVNFGLSGAEFALCYAGSCKRHWMMVELEYL